MGCFRRVQVYIKNDLVQNGLKRCKNGSRNFSEEIIVVIQEIDGSGLDVDGDNGNGEKKIEVKEEGRIYRFQFFFCFGIGG